MISTQTQTQAQPQQAQPQQAQPQQVQTQQTHEPFRDEFKCPIGHNIMKDPVIAGDGHIYDRTNIYNWFNQSNSTRSPMTNVVMSSNTVFPVVYLQSLIKEWIQSIKNKSISEDIKEMVDSYYEAQHEETTQILSDMTNTHNNDLNMGFHQNDDDLEQEQNLHWSHWDSLSNTGLQTNVELFPQETDIAILDEIEHLMTMNQANMRQNDMFGMFNASEPSVT